MTDQQLDYELAKASMSLTSRPLNDLLLEASLFLQGEYLSLFRHYFRQILEGNRVRKIVTGDGCLMQAGALLLPATFWIPQDKLWKTSRTNIMQR